MNQNVRIIRSSRRSRDPLTLLNGTVSAISKATSSIAKKIVRRAGKVKPDIKTKAFFFIMHLLQRNGFNERDVKYWKEKGWTENKRPWK